MQEFNFWEINIECKDLEQKLVENKILPLCKNSLSNFKVGGCRQKKITKDDAISIQKISYQCHAYTLAKCKNRQVDEGDNQ